VADAETEVTDQFNFEESGMRVIFQGEAIWALRFPNARSYQDFHNLYNDKLFENTFGVENDEANRQKVGFISPPPLLTQTRSLPASPVLFLSPIGAIGE